MKHINILIVVVGIFCCLVQAVSAQTTVNQREHQQAAEEPKGEVDLLIDDLKKHGEGVLKRCLENCSESSLSDSERVKAGKSIEKVQPDYPRLALAAHVTGEVIVKVVIDEHGKVIAAQVASGHPLLRGACIKAAKASTFTPTLLDQKPVKVLGSITYKFVL